MSDLWRSYKGFDAVRGVSLTVRRGELFALLGTNGAGKTSALEVIEGLAPPTKGTVRVLGHDPMRERSKVRPHTAVMLQEGGLQAGLTVTETLRMWAGTLTRSRPIDEVMDLVDLRDRARVIVRQLSGGERRRLDLALAIVGKPEILFLDEPTAGLDPESRARTWLLVRELLASGVTVLMTTHHLHEAERLADRLAILHHGVVVREGTPTQVAAAHAHRVVFRTRRALPSLIGTVDVVGDTVTVTTTDVPATLAVLDAWEPGLEVSSRPATLEEAFLEIAAGVAA
ncbi:multidrug ABC transporter ATP-binding protein [Cellulomonas chitinilytica]|uniref:Multidrug ABC transporter ATP-binding protein n=1 Tax=Cellulomonas chitinilytica TaxID=398759 RepID=A0A919TZ06_9CELL|nr:multidrug ABC transporter ATP-binding protein [Cellulomonas chitinilytica]